MNATRQTRASRPKVKTGCNNCKLRRIKCDETRPQCLKCVKANRQCGGYPVFKRPVDMALPPIAPAPSARNSRSMVRSITYSRILLPKRSRSRATRNSNFQIQRLELPHRSKVVSIPSPLTAQVTEIPFDQLEGQYFQVFRTHTANELSGFFDSEFWTRSVLVESHSEASIRHAVIALGALYKTLENAVESSDTSPNSNNNTAVNHYNYALLQYGKSIRRLRESLAAKEHRSHRTMLISLIIFTCIQSFTGDHSDAIAHIQMGLRLLEEWGQSSSNDEELIQIFTRLTIQAKSYDMAFHLPNPIRLSPQGNQVHPTEQTSPAFLASETSFSLPTTQSFIPERFKSAKEARPALDFITQRILRVMELLSSFHPGPNNILPKSVRNFCHDFGLQLDRWGIAFEPLVYEARHNLGISDTERAGALVLKMFYNMTHILFCMGFSTTEMDFDQFTSQFEEIVVLAKEISAQQTLESLPKKASSVSSPKANEKNEKNCKIKASFALELGIVPPLYVVATKCRNRKLRREAIKLLISAPRREGMWDSLLCGRLSQWIMQIEEEDFPPWDEEVDCPWKQLVPPCEKRVMVKGVLFDLQKHKATIRCGHRAKGDGEFDNRTRSTSICW